MKNIVLGVLLAVATLLVGANVATAQTSPLKLVNPQGSEAWQMNNQHTISWTPDSDNPNIEAFFEIKKGKVFQKVSQLIPCGKGSILWCIDVDTTPDNGVLNRSEVKPGSYYLSIVDKVTKKSDRTKNPVKIVKYGDVIKMSLTAHLEKNKKAKATDAATEITVKSPSVTLSWDSVAKVDQCQLNVSPHIGTDTGKSGVGTFLLPRKGTNQIFNLTGGYSKYAVSMVCSTEENNQQKVFIVTVEDASGVSTPVLDYVQAKAADKNEMYAEEDHVVYGQNLTFTQGTKEGTRFYLVDGDDKKYFETAQNSGGQLLILAFNNGYLADGTYMLYAQNGNAVSNGIQVMYRNPKSSITVLYPNGGEDLTFGAKDVDLRIKWKTTEDFSGNVNLYLQLEDGSLCFIGAADGSLGEFWKKFGINYQCPNIPRTVEDGRQYKIKISAINGASEDVSDGFFSIKNYTSGGSGNTCFYNFLRDLTLGSTGTDVVSLQTFLEAKGFLVFPAGAAKGYFGASTQAALAKYQMTVGISPADGYFGPIVRAYIIAHECPPVASVDALVVDSVNVDSDSEDGIGTFTFELDLTAFEDDVYIPVSSQLSSDNVGFDWSIVGGSATTSMVVQSDADQTGEYYVIDEGSTENFVISLYIDPAASGSYYVILNDISYRIASASGPLATLAFQPASDYDTPAVSITGMALNSAPAARIAASGSGYGPYSAMTALPDLKPGDTHEGVAAIQRFLNANGFQVAAPGQPGSVGNESTYFGQGTQKALTAYQASKGISPANGVFGPKTRAAISSTQN